MVRVALPSALATRGRYKALPPDGTPEWTAKVSFSRGCFASAGRTSVGSDFRADNDQNVVFTLGDRIRLDRECPSRDPCPLSGRKQTLSENWIGPSTAPEASKSSGLGGRRSHKLGQEPAHRNRHGYACNRHRHRRDELEQFAGRLGAHPPRAKSLLKNRIRQTRARRSRCARSSWLGMAPKS